MVEALSAAQIARLKLPDYPRSENGVADRLDRDGVPSRPRKKRGGGVEYPIATLPADLKQAVLKALVGSSQPAPAIPNVPAIPACTPKPKTPVTPPATALATWQRRTLEARAALLAELDRLTALGQSREAAIKALLAAATDGALTPELHALIPIANARSGGAEGGRTISRRTIYNWLAARDRAAETGSTAALAPRETARAKPIPPWAAPLLQLWQQPQKPALARVLIDLARELPPGVPCPSYAQARAFLARMDAVERQRGRMGPNAIRSIRPYRKRTTDHLQAGDVFVCDGHCFDAEWGHPMHGGPFRPEVTPVLDVKTRKCVGWSVDIVEHTWAVADALRMAAETHGVPAIYYADRGSGQKNKAWDDPLTGMMSRMGTERKFSIPRNSQARGTIEVFHKHLIAAARTLPTYIGADMDKDASNKIHKLTRKDIKAIGTSRLLPPWSEFRAWMTAVIADYNDRPHTKLPRIVDPITGKRRHQTPAEAWVAEIAAGAELFPLTGDEADDLFRPYETRKVSRGLVRILAGEYYLKALEAYHDDEVMVGYSIQDNAQVWVRTLEGRLIGVAKLDGHAAPYFPADTVNAARTVREKKARERAKDRLARIDVKHLEVLAELNGGAPLIEHQPAPVLTLDQVAAADAIYVRLTGAEPETAPATAVTAPAGPTATVRPIFRDDIDLVRWLLDRPEALTNADRTLLRDLVRSATFRRRLDFEGLDVGALERIAC
jgi:putative transposase